MLSHGVKWLLPALVWFYQTACDLSILQFYAPFPSRIATSRCCHNRCAGRMAHCPLSHFVIPQPGNSFANSRC
uniref:Putative secreted protein n=1 Tax=Anopheles darlingi TaxID=43151 RepID=A0A2M4DA86_ANODA